MVDSLLELQAVSIVTQLKCYGQNNHEIICKKKRRKEKETLLATDYICESLCDTHKRIPKERKTKHSSEAQGR